jgi:hypothetical protein
MVCRHCGHSRVNRPRGLCWSCYYKPGVRERYPSTSKFARHGIGNGNEMAPLPTEPTRARPGSPEKVAVLEDRARRRQALWHPLDAGMDSESYRPQRSESNDNGRSRIEDREIRKPMFFDPQSSILDLRSSPLDLPQSLLLGVA